MPTGSALTTHHRSLAFDHLKALIGTQVCHNTMANQRLLERARLTTASEIFLPSYVESDFESLERQRDPVHEIVVTDEEIRNMFPQ